MNKRKKGIIVTITITGFILTVWFILEYVYNYAVCTCIAHYNTTFTSRTFGYALLIVSTLLCIASVWRVKRLSRWWIIPVLIIFGIVFYGNGYKFYYVACTSSLYKVTFFNYHTILGNFAPKYALMNTDSLKTGNYKGQLLGYSLSEHELTLYRIGDNPLKVKTSFLFWKIRPNIFIHDLSPRLHSYRNLEYEKNNSDYERIGGEDMPIEVFMEEIFLEKEELFLGSTSKMKNQRILNETDGTTRFRFEIE